MEEKSLPKRRYQTTRHRTFKKFYYSSITLLKNVGQFNPVLNFPSCFFKIRFHIVRTGICSRTFEIPLFGY